MKKKKTKTLVLLVVLLAVLAGAYAAVMAYNKKPSGEENQTTVQEDSATVLALEGTVTEMTVESENGMLEFVLKDEVWSEKNNQGFTMKQTALNSMAGVFANLSATHTIEQATENLSEYGLDDPQYILTAKTAEGNQAVLYVGMQNTMTLEYYVYAENVPGVYTVGATSINYFARDLMDFAELPEFPEVEEGNFLSLEIRNGEDYMKTETLTESAYDMSGLLTWYVTEPFEHEYVAHTTTLDTIMTAISELSYNKAAAFDPDEAELAEMGLDKPQMELAFTYTQPEEDTAETEADPEDIKSYRLYIGNEKEESGYYYVREEGSALVLLMNKSSLDGIMSYNAKNVVNRYFALINIDSVDSIEVVLDDQSEYELVPPASDADDTEAQKLKDLYQSIISIHAEKVVDSQTGPFTMLPLSLTFHRNTEPSLFSVQFAEYDTSYYLAIVDGEGIYLVNKRDYNQYCEDVKAGFEGLSE